MLPRELTFQRMGNWSSSAAFHGAVRDWLREHGVDPADQRAVLAVVGASRRVHVERVIDLPPKDRLRLHAQGVKDSDPVPPPQSMFNKHERTTDEVHAKFGWCENVGRP